ncbi:MAG TPA: SpoIIE family protein phosphatase [Candidatus Methylacidiphilales bacterium]
MRKLPAPYPAGPLHIAKGPADRSARRIASKASVLSVPSLGKPFKPATSPKPANPQHHFTRDNQLPAAPKCAKLSHMDDSATQERYRALLRAARNLLSLTSMDDLVENILKYSCTMMQAEACSMFLPDRTTRELVIHSARGKEDAINAFRIPWDKGIAGTVFQERKFIRVDDALNDPRLIRLTNAKDGLVTRSMICAPLVDKDECFGVLQALNPIDRPVFTRLDQDIFEGLTNIVTGALIRFDREQKIDRESKLAQEMAMAMEIQKSYLPPEELSLPRSEMRVRYRPARTIGGDFYSAIALSDDKLLLAVGDVSGKGIPAALTTAQITTEIHALAPYAEDGGLNAFVNALNDGLCQRLAAGRFAATTLLLYDPKRERMEVICAGQFEPWRWRNDAWELVAVPHALALGIFRGQKFKATVLSALPGDKWVLFSDGISEGRSPAGEEYGLERLRVSLGSSGHAAEVLKRAWSGWESFVDSEHQHDDACFALVLLKPEANLEIKSSASNCKRARQFIESWALSAGYSDLERGCIVLAADEAVTNVIRHTYRSEPDKPIILSAGITDGHLHLRLRDYGPPVEAVALKGRELEDLKPGGLGLHLLKSVFTTVEHIKLSDGNEWHLAKPLPV